jgi:GH15 family glucan-1,4-alpha-glucosidase
MQSSITPNPVLQRTIGEHGIIGNLKTAALVALDGTVDFMCWPSLDSPTVFAALLDPEKGGEFSLSPQLGNVRTIQMYLTASNVLLTRWLSVEGSAEVTDLMPYPNVKGGIERRLIRCVVATRGRVDFTLRCRPRFNYARIVPETASAEDGVIFTGTGMATALHLSGCVPIVAGEGEATARFTLNQGDKVYFVLRDVGEHVYRREEIDACVRATIEAWQAWARRSTYVGRWREQVTRSALALKLLVSHEHGSIAAAATFGLPEASGAGRNWDYRATWIRDASFTVYAFIRLGYINEVERFREWGARLNSADPAKPLNVMYSLDGTQAADETELHHLSGYGESRPVRIGNAAHNQTQLDIYGELLDSVYLANKYGTAVSHDTWSRLSTAVEYVIGHWEAADAGIWEIRGEPRHFLHSRMMCWVALDRAVRLAQKRSLPAPMGRWLQERDRISQDIWTHFRHPQNGHFVQSRGGTELDASLLMMPLVRFVSATDPVWLSTLDAIRDELTDGGLVTRYRNKDGLDGGEGSFTTCTFWYVECLARAGRLEEAQHTMEKALGFANHLGLFSEELNIVGEPLGNFPQALTHLSMISAAHFLERRLSNSRGSEWQS